jgi:peptidoglycan/LPS O-acetylase OafA/YrhL
VHYFLNTEIYNFFRSTIDIHSFYSRLLTSFVTTAIAIALSVASYYIFEMKFLKLKEKFQ